MKAYEVKSSRHSIERAFERLNAKNEAIARNYIARALKNGKDLERYTSKDRKFLESKTREGFFIKVFSNVIYIFTNNGECVTMYDAPKWFGKCTRV